MPRVLTQPEIDRQLADLPRWQHQAGDEPTISVQYEFDDFSAALAFVNMVGAEAEDMNHHPDIDIRWNQVKLAVATHSEGGITQLDIELAHRIDALVPPA